MRGVCGLCVGSNLQQGVPLEGVHVQARVVDFVAEVTLLQFYVNDASHPIEAVYVFPLDSDAAVCDFQAEINGKVIAASVKEKEEAKREYQQAKARGDGAYLLEEHKEDIFQVSVGNIPAQTRVNIMISYVAELKILEDGSTRFLLPTTVAPRYTPPTTYTHITYHTPWYRLFPKRICWDHFFCCDRVVYETVYYPHVHTHMVVHNTLPTPPVQRNVPYALSLSLEVHGASKITKIDSGTHCIEWQQAGDKLALVKFLHDKEQMNRDFVLRIYHEQAHQPRALVEVDGESAAAMLTLVPEMEFADVKAEVVFVVDRSGSMSGGKISKVAEALLLFIRALPADCYFNIVGFGSSFQSLFPASVQYDDATLQRASAHLRSLQADLGGTEILNPLRYVFAQPHRPLHARQVFVLTDGEVSNTEQVVALVQQNCLDKDGADITRCFSIGVGNAVSHALVDGIARAGNGTAQFIVEGERLEAKVMKQLKEALQPAITAVEIDWGVSTESPVGEPTPGAAAGAFQTTTQSSLLGAPAAAVPANTSGGLGSFFGHKSPTLVQQEQQAKAAIKQAPFKVPPVFSGHRFMVFAFMKASALPSNITLQAQSPDGPLKLALPVERHSGNLVHRLAARKMIRDLEESRSYMHSHGRQPAVQTVRQQIVALGTKFSLASKYTSFIAVEDRSNDFMWQTFERHAYNPTISCPTTMSAPVGRGGSVPSSSSSFCGTQGAAAPRQSFGFGGGSYGGVSYGGVPYGGRPYGGGPYGGGPYGAPAPAPQQYAFCAPSGAPPPPPAAAPQSFSFGASYGAPPPPPAAAPAPLASDGSCFGGYPSQEMCKNNLSFRESALEKTRTSSSSSRNNNNNNNNSDDDVDMFDSPAPAASRDSFALTSAQPKPASSTGDSIRDRLNALVLLLKSDGSFNLDARLANFLRVTEAELQQGKSANTQDALWATAVAIAFADEFLVSLKDEWELVFGKSRQWLAKQAKASGAQPSDLLSAAKQFLKNNGIRV